MSRIVEVSSVFEAQADTVWAQLQKVSTLQYIAAPMAAFTQVEGAALVWRQGAQAAFALRIFGVFPMGIHRIYVQQFDQGSMRVQTCEGNRMVPIWNHEITVSPAGAGKVRYTDRVELGAGVFTLPVYWWANCFYRHRQRKWLKLLNKIQKV